jgi:hypothetical protein
MTRDKGKSRLAGPVSLDRMNICVAKSTSLDLYENFMSLWTRWLRLHDFASISEVLKDSSLHHYH